MTEIKNMGQIKGGKARIAGIRNKNRYFKLLHSSARLKAKKVKHIINWKIRTKIGKEIINKKINPSPLIIAMLLTDGHVYKKRNCFEIGFASKSSSLLYLFLDLIKIWNRKQIVSKYIDKNRVTRLYFHLPIKNEFIKSVKSFKTSPRNQSVRNYLKEDQPNIDFLENMDNECKRLFLRIILSLDGGITNRKGIKRIQPSIFLRCAHLSLCKFYQKIANDFSIKLRIEKDKSKWSGIDGLSTTKIESIKKFKEIGGFVDGLKISKKSKYFYNIKKNFLLNSYIRNSVKVEGPASSAWIDKKSKATPF